MNCLLDTNAYFNYLKYKMSGAPDLPDISKSISIIDTAKCYISRITQIEIISVIGKYSRGTNNSMEKCQCIISSDGKKCENYRYTQTRKKLNKRQIKAWLKLIREVSDGTSPVFHLDILPISEEVLVEAQYIINYAFSYGFGSLDSIVIATAKHWQKSNPEDRIVSVTSDKSMKAVLCACDLPVWDAFSKKVTLSQVVNQ